MNTLKKTNIILTGMPAAGKSTAGVLLAKKACLSFLDTDLYLQREEKSILPDIIKKKGIDGFLKTEEHYVSLLSVENTVIATGGSVIYSPVAMKHLKSSGICVYLEIDPMALESRIASLSQRGVIRKKDQDIHSLFIERQPLYAAYADVIVDTTGQSPGETADSILASLEGNYDLYL
jgi:shikimate kinase